MKQNQSSAQKAYSLVAPSTELPQLMTTCPRCGGEVDIWTEGEETVCVFCNQQIFGRITSTN